MRLRCRYLTPDTRCRLFTDGREYEGSDTPGRLVAVKDDLGRTRMVIPHDPSNAFCEEVKLAGRYSVGQRAGTIVFEQIRAQETL